MQHKDQLVLYIVCNKIVTILIGQLTAVDMRRTWLVETFQINQTTRLSRFAASIIDVTVWLTISCVGGSVHLTQPPSRTDSSITGMCF